MQNRNIYTYNKWGIVAATALFSFFLFYLNHLVLYLPGDDYIFQLKIPDEGILGSERISSISDLVESQINFYNNYHYRIFNHTILQVLLLCPPWVFDLMNTLVFLALPACIMRIRTFEDNKTYGSLYLTLLFFIWIFHFNLGRSYFLTTGSLNYTWLLIPQILYLTELFKYLDGKGKDSWLILLAIANAMTNENAMIVLIVLTLIISLAKRKEGIMSLIFCLLILIGGTMFMLNSPSIDLRLEDQGFRSAGLWSHAKEYLIRTAYYFIRYLPVALIYLLISFNQPNEDIRAFALTNRVWLSKSSLLTLGILLATSSMFFIPLFEPRSAVFGFFLLLMLVLCRQKITCPSVNTLFILSILAILIAMVRYPHFVAHNQRHLDNQNILTAYKNQQVEVKLHPYCDDSQKSYLLCHELSNDNNYLDNKSLAHFYKVKSVRLQESKRRENQQSRIYSTITNNTMDYNSFVEQPINKDKLLFRNNTKAYEILTVADDDNYYIIRGAVAGFHQHRLVEILPPKFQLFLLDYLEDTTQKKQNTLAFDSEYYNYSSISKDVQYKYFLVSQYSTADHSSVGEIIKVNLTY